MAPQDNDPPKDNLIALHRPPPAPPRRPAAWLDELLSRPGAQALVQALPEQELYLAVRELGLADAIDLLRLCSPEQVRACLDIDCWRRDRLDQGRFLAWVGALLELGHLRLGRVIQALDHELLVSFLQHQVRVYDLSMEEVPDEPEGTLYQTPDRFYVVELLGEGADVVGRLLEALYAADLDLARRVVMGARWDVGAETEEAALRFRSARMADLGYVDYYDALRIYAFLDPHSVRLGEETAPPLQEDDRATTGLVLTEIEGALGDSIFALALAALDPLERDALLRQLLLLLNQALSADRVDPADLEGARGVMQRAAGYLSLAVEYLARPGAEGEKLAATLEGRAVLALKRVALSRLFRLGHSLTLQLQRLGTVLARRGLVTLVPRQDPASLLEPPLDEVVRLLTPPLRPLFSAQLEGGPAGGRPFRRLADVVRTAAALEEIRAVGDFLTVGLGVRTDTLSATLAGKSPPLHEIRLSDLLGTLVANLLLGRPPALVPLSRRDVPALRQAVLGLGEGAGTVSEVAQRAVRETLRARVRERSLGEEEAGALWSSAAERLLEHTLTRLGRSLTALPPDLGAAQADVIPSLPGLILG